ncbi:MAG TPA: amidase, partial [Acidimicrobiales bacterium]|nr:amidase [Acidimicrobiales bacterium]
VRGGRLSASDLVTASIERLEAANPTLNVLAEAAFDDAIEAAGAIDRGERPTGPLAGIPTLIKDLEDWRGHQTRKGSLALRDVAPATSNGVVPQRLLDAGVVIVGKSTLPEFAVEGYTANLLTGVTRNPWNIELSPGGSSGGSAAALMAGLVGVATATDGGGSIRIPASFCGLVGIKPTNGLIGRWPAHDWIDYSTDGPFATSSDDLRLLLDVMAGPVAGDPTAATRAFLANMTRLDGRPLRVFAAERTSPFGPLPGGVERAFHDAVNAFAEVMKASISWRDAEGFFVDGDPDLDWFTVTTAEHVASLGRAWVEEHMDEFHVSSQEFLSAGLAITAEEYLAARRRRFLYVRTLDELLGEDGVLLTPTLAAEGCMADGRLRPDAEVHGLPPEVYSTAMQNITGHPALSLPFGMLPTGLPFGLQVTAGHYDDYKLLDIADLMEAAHPWARTAPGYESLANVLLA